MHPALVMYAGLLACDVLYCGCILFCVVLDVEHMPSMTFGDVYGGDIAGFPLNASESLDKHLRESRRVNRNRYALHYSSWVVAVTGVPISVGEC